MPIPTPEPGLVISYAYLWHHESQAGQEEGRKDRPSVIVLAVERQADDATLVTVLPITHKRFVAFSFGFVDKSCVQKFESQIAHRKRFILVCGFTKCADGSHRHSDLSKTDPQVIPSCRFARIHRDLRVMMKRHVAI